MEDLDSNLRNILEKAGVTYRKDMSAKDAAVNEIKRAFKDAGYEYKPNCISLDEKYFQDWLHNNGWMTGQEWHRRFSDALGKPTHMNDEDGRHAVYKIEWIAEAAKKAFEDAGWSNEPPEPHEVDGHEDYHSVVEEDYEKEN